MIALTWLFILSKSALSGNKFVPLNRFKETGSAKPSKENSLLVKLMKSRLLIERIFISLTKSSF